MSNNTFLECKGNNRTIYTTSTAKRDGKDNQDWASRETGEYWTRCISTEVALRAAAAGTGTVTVTLQHSHRLWHATGIAFPPAHVHRRTRRGPGGKAGSICVSYMHTHFLSYRASPPAVDQQSTRHSTRELADSNSLRGQINHFPALTGIFHCKVPPTPQKKVSHALYILYSAELGVLSRFLQTKKQVKSEVLHGKRFYIYTESTSLVLSLKPQVKAQTGSFFSLSLSISFWTEEILVSFSSWTVGNDPRNSRALDPKGSF